MDPLNWETQAQQHYPRIYRAALVLSGNAADAEDLAQETFYQALRSAHRFVGKSRPATWLYAILLNQYRRHERTLHRRARRRRIQWEIFGARRQSQRQQDDAPDRRLRAVEWQQSVWSAVSELPAPQRDSLVLRYGEGLTNDQIAEVVGCPLGTVKSRIHHGLASLQKKVSGEFELTEVEMFGACFSLKAPDQKQISSNVNFDCGEPPHE